MARSKHNIPDELRARSRLLEPYAARGKNDRTALRSIVSSLKESGIFFDLPPVPLSGIGARPRVTIKPAKKGFTHPVGKEDILSVVEFFGERCFYGLRAIKLSQRPSANTNHLLLGRLEVPGTIILYEQPISPWLITGIFTVQQKKILERAGAIVEADADALQTIVRWSPKT